VLESKTGEAETLMAGDVTALMGSEAVLDIQGEVVLDISGETELDTIGETELDTRGETKLLRGDIDAFDMALASTGDTPVLTTGDARPPKLLIDEMALLSTGESPPLTATPTVRSCGHPTPDVVAFQGNSGTLSIAEGDANSGPSSTGERNVVVVVETEGYKVCAANGEDVIPLGVASVVVVVVVV
jgi:hypothetical protein